MRRRARDLSPASPPEASSRSGSTWKPQRSSLPATGSICSTCRSAMRTLICGSIAYDNIMVFQGRFREHILPEQIHILNVAFLVPELRREFGGCAGNIAYNLKLLGSDPLVMATVGDDSLLYFERLERLGIELDFVRQGPGTPSPKRFITSTLMHKHTT